MRESLRGVAAGLLTPFDDDRDIDHAKLAENADALYDEGIRTFLAAANISEYHALSRDERVAVTETSVDALPSDACVLAGVGGSVDHARDLIEGYDRIGVDALMVMPPDFTYIHERGLLRYYEALSDVTETPLVPYVRGFDPSTRYLSDLTRVDGLVGIKYAIPDPVKLGVGVENGADDVVWVDGLAEPYAPSLWAEGAEGFSAGVSNFRPEIGLALFDALSEEDWERARAIKNITLPYQRFRSETGADNEIADAISVPAVKKGLELAGLNGGHVRAPICSLSAEDERRAEELYRQLDDDIERLID
ncbi:dihydrodipicolinate synthase/N-acetylneuraminate lyase [Halarchaeum acidiphilum MH1-52-1]|uniref:Dihydrodipicolinate synthase/N-acetylneuraminate lyase n=1 Tax=Halarchaeum acidiphilum MH1-52-1 TaxID=1261545 RepID=U3A1J2_9EURY|nr:dihydrodipicolinate synthase/N-acetylneuraminate lyase [Halarchaeum acidiphilum MH1-52-1]